MDNEPVIGKIFLANIAAWLLGKQTFLKVKGNPEEVNVIRGALEASKAFQDELYRQEATVQTIMDALQLKRIATAEFETLTGLKWPL